MMNLEDATANTLRNLIQRASSTPFSDYDPQQGDQLKQTNSLPFALLTSIKFDRPTSPACFGHASEAGDSVKSSCPIQDDAAEA
ncbi:MAG: hypothetical protein VYA84_11380 [Planctomycetota bacterium]|nr:hypothetical protein [Planctomycetota bacterium]